MVGDRAKAALDAVRTAADATTRGARRAVAVSKQVLDRVLAALERLLLSPKRRERMHASAVFALIFAFAVSSVDFLITGGPSFNLLIEDAAAMEPTSLAPRIAMVTPQADFEITQEREREGVEEISYASANPGVLLGGINDVSRSAPPLYTRVQALPEEIGKPENVVFLSDLLATPVESGKDAADETAL